MSSANYLTIKKVTTHEEWFRVEETDLTAEKLEEMITNGEVNIIQSFTREDHLWVTNVVGKKVALLVRDGALGPDEEVEITADNKNIDEDGNTLKDKE